MKNSPARLKAEAAAAPAVYRLKGDEERRIERRREGKEGGVDCRRWRERGKKCGGRSEDWIE